MLHIIFKSYNNTLTTRKVLNGLLKFNVRFTEDMLETLLCEVENIVNGILMIKLSGDVIDFSALDTKSSTVNTFWLQ